MRYVRPGTISDVTEAVRHLIEEDMLPNVNSAVVQDVQAFRETQCYIEPVDAVFRARETSLRAIFSEYANGFGQNRPLVRDSISNAVKAAKLENELLSIDDFLRLLRVRPRPPTRRYCAREPAVSQRRPRVQPRAPLLIVGRSTRRRGLDAP